MTTIIDKKCETKNCPAGDCGTCRTCRTGCSNTKKALVLGWTEALRHRTVGTALASLPADLASTDGTVVFVPAGCRVEGPVRLADCGSPNGTLAVVAEAGSELTLLDTARCGCGDGPQQARLLIFVGRGATVRLTELRCLLEDQRFDGRIWASVNEDGRLKLFSGLLGGGHLNCRTEIALESRGAAVERYGLALGTENGHCEMNDTIRHFAVGTSSYIMTRSVLTDHASADWRLLTEIEPKAEECDGRQDCRTLLLSPTARAEIVPSFEIGTDDVTCSHSASIGQPDAQSLFYLESRGLPAEQARRLTALGFFRPLVERIWDDETRETVLGMIQSRLECRVN